MKKIGLFVTIALALASCSSDDAESIADPLYSSDTGTSSESSSSATVPTSGGSVTLGEIVDSRDGNVYKTTVIGNQVWMAENLRFDVQEYLEKGPYLLADPNEELDECTSIYSALYNFYFYSERKSNYYYWKMAIDSAGLFSSNASECAKTGDCSKQGHIRGICPEGFHVPDSAEVEELYIAVGGRDLAAKDLREESYDWINSYLEINYIKTTKDKYGFSAAPDGHIAYALWDQCLVPDHVSDPPVEFLTNKNRQTWGIDDNDDKDAHDGVFHSFIHDELDYFYSMRCLRDEPAGVD